MFKNGSSFLDILIICCALGCDNPAENGDEKGRSTVEISFDDVRPDEYFPWSKVIDSIQIIPLETNKNSLISEIQKLQVTKDRIYIHDRKQNNLLIFSVDGKFINKLKIGAGPNEEIIEVRDFLIDDRDSLHVLTFNKINVYDSDGNYLRSKSFDLLRNYKYKVNPLQFAVTSDGTYFFWVGSIGISDFDSYPSYALYLMEDNLEGIQKQFFKLERGLLEQTRFANKTDEQLIVPFITSDTVFAVDLKEKSISSRYFISLGERTISSNLNLFEQENESKILYEIQSEHDLCGVVRNLHVTHDYMWFAYNCGKDSYAALYSKKSNKIINGLGFDFNDFIQFILIKTAYGEKLVFDIEGTRFQRMLGKMQDMKDKDICELPPYQRQIFNVMKTLDINSNPIICIASIHEF